MLTDKDIYEAYKDYQILEIKWFDNNNGQMKIKFPSAVKSEHWIIKLRETGFINFTINENNVIKFSIPLPEFVLKDAADQIRDIRDEQFLWGV